jgi:hypothetical protein
MWSDVSKERITSIFTVRVQQVISHLLHAGFLLGSFSTLQMEVIRSSVTSANIRTTRRCILEDGSVHNYSWENLKSYTLFWNVSCQIPTLITIIRWTISSILLTLQVLCPYLASVRTWVIFLDPELQHTRTVNTSSLDQITQSTHGMKRRRYGHD